MKSPRPTRVGLRRADRAWVSPADPGMSTRQRFATEVARRGCALQVPCHLAEEQDPHIKRVTKLRTPRIELLAEHADDV